MGSVESMPLERARLDLRRGQAEDEDIVVADLLVDLDIGAVERADGQRAVERQLHVAGAGGFDAGGRDLLGQVGRGHDHLGQRDVVVRQEDDLERPRTVGSALMTFAMSIAA